MNPKSFFGELKRRNVYKVAVAYVVAGWALAQGLAQVLPVFNVPNWIIQLLVMLIVIGLPVALGLAWAFELTPAGIKRTDEADETNAARAHKKRAWLYVVVIGVFVSIGLFFLGRYTAAPGQASAKDLSAKSVAVLPFENLSDDKQNTYFADGVQDQILTNLAKASELRVISHTTVRQYKSGMPRNLREIGQQLGVTYILEGSVRRAGDRLRISAQLIDARTDSQIWAETYDRTAADLFAIQSELAESAVALDPRNPNAYNLLADTYNLQRRYVAAAQVYDRVVAAGERTPIVLFRRASALFNGTGDSGGLGEVLAKNPEMDVGGGQTPVRVFLALIDRNFAEAERVLAASPREDFQDIDYSFYYPRAWFAAMIARAKADSASALETFSSARAILEQRLAVKPEHARTLAVLAQVDAGLGRKDLAIQEAQHAVDLMPVSKDIYDGVLVLEGLAQVYTWTSKPDRAIELLQKLVTMPGYINYARLKLHPMWDPLRGDPRFQKIVNSLAPKDQSK